MHLKNFVLNVRIVVRRLLLQFNFQTALKFSSRLNRIIRNSDQDKIILDDSYIEKGIYSLWKLDLWEFVKVKASLAKNFHISPLEFDKMPVWEFELFMKHLNNLIKEENDNQKNEMDKSGISNMQKNMNNPSKMAGNMKMPSMKMPSMKMPKF